MRVHRFAVLVITALTAGVGSSSAQETGAVQVTPFVALGTAAASPVGAWVTVPLTSKLSLEHELAYRRGEGDMHALSASVSLLYWLPRLGPTTPYVAAGAGVAQFGTPIVGSTGRPIGTQARLAMTVNAGGGVKTRVTDAVDLRTDLRWSQSLGRDGTEEFRVAQGVSFDVARRGGSSDRVTAPGSRRVGR